MSHSCEASMTINNKFILIGVCVFTKVSLGIIVVSLVCLYVFVCRKNLLGWKLWRRIKIAKMLQVATCMESSCSETICGDSRELMTPFCTHYSQI